LEEWEALITPRFDLSLPPRPQCGRDSRCLAPWSRRMYLKTTIMRKGPRHAYNNYRDCWGSREWYGLGDYVLTVFDLLERSRALRLLNFRLSIEIKQEDRKEKMNKKPKMAMHTSGKAGFRLNKPSPSPSAVSHDGIKCDNCGTMPITGPRFKCA